MKFFVPDADAEAELAADPEIQANMAAGPARDIAARAAAFANPILLGPSAPNPPIQAGDDPDEGAVVATYDSGWHFDEFGNAYNPPNAPLRRGVGAAGYRFEDEPRT